MTKTGNITSILPLVKDLPVRLTESVDRKRRLYKDRPGQIVGWALHPQEDSMTVDEHLLLTNCRSAFTSSSQDVRG